jgi:hypothetical protein
MIKKHTGAKKLVNEFTGGDPEPTWEDKLKNQMGYGRTSSIAKKIHSDKSKNGAEDADQLMSDLGLKSSTENDRPEKAKGGKKIV